MKGNKMATESTLPEYVDAGLYSKVYQCMTQSGVVIADTSSVKDDVETVFRNLFGADVDLTPETPLGRIVEWWVFTLTQFARITAQNANQMNLNYATGIYLDGLATLFRLSRRSATHTRVPVVLTGEPGVVVPSGRASMSDANGNVYRLEDDVTIGEAGTGSGIAVALEPGAVSVAVNELNHVDAAIVGWYGVNNPDSDSSYSLGGLVESDADFRARIAASRSSGMGFVESIKKAVDAVDGVTDTVIVENNTGAVQEVEGVEMSPHSVFVCVDGGNNQAVAEAVFRGKSAGCAYTRIGTGRENDPFPYEAYPSGGEQGAGMTVYDACGISHKVYFYRPEPVSVAVQVRVNLMRYTGSDYVADVKTAVLAWAAGQIDSVQRPRIGMDVYSGDIAQAINALYPSIWVRSVGVKEGGVAIASGAFAQSLAVAGSQRATVADSQIQVIAV